MLLRRRRTGPPGDGRARLTDERRPCWPSAAPLPVAGVALARRSPASADDARAVGPRAGHTATARRTVRPTQTCPSFTIQTGRIYLYRGLRPGAHAIRTLLRDRRHPLSVRPSRHVRRDEPNSSLARGRSDRLRAVAEHRVSRLACAIPWSATVARASELRDVVAVTRSTCTRRHWLSGPESCLEDVWTGSPSPQQVECRPGCLPKFTTAAEVLAPCNEILPSRSMPS